MIRKISIEGAQEVVSFPSHEVDIFPSFYCCTIAALLFLGWLNAYVTNLEACGP